MNVLTDHLILADSISAGANKGLLCDFRNTLQGRRQGNDLEYGTGNETGLDEPIHIHSIVIGSIFLCKNRYIIRIIGRGGHSAQKLTCFIIVHRNCSFIISHSFQGSCLHLRGQGQLRNTAGLGIAVNTIEQVISHQIPGMVGQSRGTDAAVPISQPVDCRFPHRKRVRIGSAFIQI